MHWTSTVVACALLLAAFTTSLAQESPEEAKRRAAIEAERRALEERKLREKDEAAARAMEEAKRKAEAERRAAQSGKDAPQAQFRVTLAGTVANEQGIKVGGGEILVQYNSTAASGEPVTVAVPATISAGKVGADGVFRAEFVVQAVAHVKSLALGISVTHADYLPGPQLVLDAERGSEHTGLALTLRAGAEVSGRVIEDSGAPLAGVLVRAVRDTGLEKAAGKQPLVEQTREVRTDRNGNYTIKGLHPGSYEVSTLRTGWGSADYTPKLELKERQAKPGFDFKLPRVTALFAKVTLSDGGTGTLRVQVRFANGEKQGLVSNGVIENGQLVVETANTGAWTIEIVSDDYLATAPTEVEIVENKHHDLGEITLTRKAKEDYPELPND